MKDNRHNNVLSIEFFDLENVSGIIIFQGNGKSVVMGAGHF